MSLARPSVTLRLAALFAAVSTAVLLALGGTIGYLVEAHFEMLDAMELGNKMVLIQHTLAKARAPVAAEELRARLDDALFGQDGLMVAVSGEDGRSWYRTPGADFPAAVLEAGVGLEHLGHAKPQVWQGAQRHFRGIVATRLNIAALGAPVSVAIAVDTAHHRAFMADFRSTLWAAVILGVAMSSLLGWIVARRGMAPVRAIALVARGISAERLHDRLPLAQVPAELEELAAAFNDMLARLEDSFRRLSDFSSDIAHELRTPVSNLLTQTQVALSQPRSAAEYREILYSSLEEYERLARMVSDMLFLAKADNGLIVPRRDAIDLARAADELIEFYRALAEEREVSLSRSGAGEMVGDPLMIRRAISNLLSNALRHASPGGRIEIGIEAQARRTLLAVSNTGEGIDAEFLPRLFDRFYRVDPSRSRSGEGSGLGLAIVKSIVTAHAGEISVRCADGCTTFTLTFPGAG